MTKGTALAATRVGTKRRRSRPLSPRLRHLPPLAAPNRQTRKRQGTGATVSLAQQGAAGRLTDTGRLATIEQLPSIDRRITIDTVRDAAKFVYRAAARTPLVRLDYPERDDAQWQANIVVRRQQDGMALALEPNGRANGPA